jgi:hypothetical protein
MTNTEIQEVIDEYIKAERAVLKGKSYTIGARSLSRENLPDIREGRQEWEQKLATSTARSAGRNNHYSLADFS